MIPGVNDQSERQRYDFRLDEQNKKNVKTALRESGIATYIHTGRFGSILKAGLPVSRVVTVLRGTVVSRTKYC